MSYLVAKIRDFSDEYTTFRLKTPDLITGSVWDTPEGWAESLEAALGGAILGTLVSVTFSQDGVINEDTRPASGEAQREKGLRLVYVDNITSKRYGFTIGTADFDALAQPGTDIVPLAHAEVAPIVTFVEATVLSPAGNAITVESAKIVGRGT